MYIYRERVCVCERERERERVCVCVRESVCERERVGKGRQGWREGKIGKVSRIRREVELEDRKSTRLNSSHQHRSRMPSSA